METLSRLLPALDKFAPGIRNEITGFQRTRKWQLNPVGILQRVVQLDADGPLLKAYLGVFAAKLAMALYREHVGEALPLHGAAYTTHFLNAGLNQEQLDAMLSVLPTFGQLRQGKKTSKGQFGYRFNCDKRSIVGAVASFHGNLHVMAFATSDIDTYGSALTTDDSVMTRPGELLQRLPSAVSTEN